MLQKLWNDDHGFIISAELVLVATLLVIGLIVGLSEVQHSVVAELNDVGDAIGSLNQSYKFTGFKKDDMGAVHASTPGSYNRDTTDACDMNQCTLACHHVEAESPKCSD